MPPKAKITREMIIDAAFEIVRQEGADHINARTVSKKLSCSTQPILYHFEKIEDVRIAAHKKGSEFHIHYVTDLSGNYERPMLEMGMRYIQFAVEEKNLFRFLFHSNYYTSGKLSDWLTEENLGSVFSVLKIQAEVDVKQAYSIFSQIYLVTHGLASLLANNTMLYDKTYCIKTLSNAYLGAISLMKEGNLL